MFPDIFTVANCFPFIRLFKQLAVIPPKHQRLGQEVKVAHEQSAFYVITENRNVTKIRYTTCIWMSIVI